MNFDEDSIALRFQLSQLSVSHKEGAAGLKRQIVAPKHSQDGEAKAIFFHNQVTAPRVLLGQISGAAYLIQPVDFIFKFFLIPDVITQRDGVNAGCDQLVSDFFSDTCSARRVFSVGDHNVRA